MSAMSESSWNPFSWLGVSTSRTNETPVHELWKEKYCRKPEILAPPFFEGTFAEACAEASKNFKFLVVYLHCPSHPLTDQFCKDVFNHPFIVDLILNNFVLWGSSVFSAAGHEQSIVLQATTYPYVAVLSCTTREPRMLTKLEGDLTVQFLHDNLERCFSDNGAHLIAARADQREREEREALRQQQDFELAESLRIDQERQAARQLQEQQVRREQEELERQSAENEARQAALTQRRLELRNSLPPEPPAGAENVATLRITLLDGSCVERRFQSLSTVQDVCDYVKSLDSYSGQEICVSTPLPVTVLDPDSTLVEAQLCPRARVVIKTT